jgi:predicted Zn-dependent protease
MLLAGIADVHAQSSARTPDELLRRVESAQHDGISNDIVRDLTALLVSEPNNARVHYVAAKVYERCGFTDLADKEFDLFDKLDPNGSLTVLDQFVQNVVNGDTAAANRDYRYVVGHFPEEPILMVLYAQIAQRKGNIADADFFLSQALFVTPHQQGIPTAAAELLLQRGSQRESRRALSLVQEDLARKPHADRTSVIAQKALQINQRLDESELNRKNDIAWRVRLWLHTGK